VQVARTACISTEAPSPEIESCPSSTSPKERRTRSRVSKSKEGFYVYQVSANYTFQLVAVVDRQTSVFANYVSQIGSVIKAVDAKYGSLYNMIQQNNSRCNA
jgi:hypothetical protein